ncbi:peptidyl-prolyl cis-trans isomerase [bacterium]|nr:peptidyl-prolyl cis-trans isomerase [candidate division CSSED10-310 bacterium]
MATMKWLAYILVGCALMLAACGQQQTPATDTIAAGEPEGDQQIVAKINGQAITMAQLDQRVGGLVDKFKELNPDINIQESRLNNLRQNFLERLISDTLLLQECDSRNITVDDEEVTKRVDQLRGLFGATKEAKEYFESGVKDWGKFEQEVKKQARIQKLYDAEAEKRVHVSDEDVETYYKNHPAEFDKPDQVNIHLIMTSSSPMIRPGMQPPGEPPSEEEVVAQIKAAAKRLNEGDDFAAVAAEYSKDVRTANKGGETGLLNKEAISRMYAPQVADKAFTMKPGETSEIISTEQGHFIIRVDEFKPAYTQTFDEAATTIRDMLTRQARAEVQTNVLEELKSKAKIEKFL